MKLCRVWSWGPFHDQWNSIKMAIWRAVVRFSSVANINHGPFRSGCWGKGKQTALRGGSFALESASWREARAQPNKLYVHTAAIRICSLAHRNDYPINHAQVHFGGAPNASRRDGMAARGQGSANRASATVSRHDPTAHYIVWRNTERSSGPCCRNRGCMVGAMPPSRRWGRAGKGAQRRPYIGDCGNVLERTALRQQLPTYCCTRLPSCCGRMEYDTLAPRGVAGTKRQ